MSAVSISVTAPPVLSTESSPSSYISSSAPLPALDLSGLTSPDLFVSETAWLDSLLLTSASASATTSLAQLDSSLVSTLNLLDLATADTSALVDRTIEEIARSVPRLSFDLGLLRENTVSLKLTLAGIRKRSKKDNALTSASKELDGQEEEDVNAVLERLRVLDLIKSRMEAARDVLREAESWSTLDSEVTALIADSSYSKAATRLAEAARSMVVFQNTVEYEGRRALMVSLQNQLEAALSASLVAAIASRDVKGCKGYFAIFQQIEREGEFTAYYFGSRRSALVANWTKAKLVDCPEETRDLVDPEDRLSNERVSSPIKLSAFLTKFYAELLSLLNEERTYIPAIFPSASPTFAAFIQTTLESLSPSTSTRLAAIENHYRSATLPELILAYKATSHFATLVDKIVVQLALSAPPITPTTAKPDSRLSKRMSISRRRTSKSYADGTFPGFHSAEGPGESSGVISGWEATLFEPFLDWQVEYPRLEGAYLDQEIQRTVSVNGEMDIMSYLAKGELDRGARVLSEKTTAVLALAEEALGRNLAFTHGYATVETLRVIDGRIVMFMEARKAELDTARMGGARVHGGTQAEDELELEGLEYTTSDWGTFQFGLRLLDTCRGISDKLAVFEAKVKAQLVALATSLKDTSHHSVGVVGSTTRGAIMMLQQSTLNSVDLARLVDSLDATPPATPLVSYIPRSKSASTDLARATQLFLHSAIIAPLLAHLQDYSDLSTWSVPDSPVGGTGAKGSFDLVIPTFSLSPSETISKVGEGLFNLPRLFEVYADDNALGVSIETLPFVDTESLRALLYPPQLTTSTTRHLRRASSDPSAPSPTSPTTPISGHAPSPLAAETVISTWLSSLTLSLLSHLTTRVLPGITKLSKSGAAQLAADLAYISNVARALDVEAGDELDVWREATESDESAWRKRISEDGVVLPELWEKVGRTRGWKVSLIK